MYISMKEFYIKIDNLKDSFEKETLHCMIDNHLESLFCDVSSYLNTDKTLPLDGLKFAVHLNNYSLKYLITEIIENAVDASIENKIHQVPCIETKISINDEILSVVIVDSGSGFSDKFFDQKNNNQILSTKNSSSNYLGGAGAGLTKVISSLASQNAEIKFYNKNDLKLTGGIVEIQIPKKQILNNEEYLIQQNQRSKNRVTYFKYAHTGKYSPPVNDPIIAVEGKNIKKFNIS